jgi:transcription elongation GreA/GreB family factor
VGEVRALIERVVTLDKSAVLREVVVQLECELRDVVASQQAAIEAATHEESKPENDKDTRALESSYLARGQAQRATELREELARIATLRPIVYGAESPIGATAIVVLQSDEEEFDVYLLLPAAGGLEVVSNGLSIRTVTHRSPLGRAMLGATEGQDFELNAPRGRRTLTVVAVC